MKKTKERVLEVRVLLLIFFLVLFLGCNSENKNEKIKGDTEQITVNKQLDRHDHFKKHQSMKAVSEFKDLKWQFLGPKNTSGRMTDTAITFDKEGKSIIYTASASGGVFKSTDEGDSWVPIFEDQVTSSIGDLAVDPSNSNVLWVGTGESNLFRSSMAGAGIYKTEDRGKTWKHMGLTQTLTIARIIVHPANSNIVYVAASGPEWTENKERGLYKTEDGGKTWKNILFKDELTGAIDLVMDPVNSDIIYVSTWQRIRKKWNDPRTEPQYTGCSIFKTTDAGATFTEITKGLPLPKHRGRIGLDIARSNPKVIYAFIDNYEIARETTEEDLADSYGVPSCGFIKGATVFRSDDSGENWKKVSGDSKLLQRLCGTYGWVFGQVSVDPNNENRVYIQGVGVALSEDGGKTFVRQKVNGGDNHGIWINPKDSSHMILNNDHGVHITKDQGKTWKSSYKTINTVQFFNVNYDVDTPFHVYGSIQDHGSRRGIVDLSKGRDSIPSVDWENAPGGEGSNHAVDPTNTNIVYSAGFYGTLSRTNIKTKERKTIVPKAQKGEPRLRGQWLAGFILSPHDSNTIYHGMNFLFKSVDQGKTWKKISPDLSYNNPQELGDVKFQTIFTVSESPLKKGLLYVGTDDGRIWVTKNDGTDWEEINQGIQKKKWISGVVASAFEEGTVYMSQNGKRDDDFSVYIYKSKDYGKTWKEISSNIPMGPVNVIREDPKDKNILYAGTDLAVYVSKTGGESWSVLGGNLPSVYVHDLVIHPRDNIIVIATHGRGMYALDANLINSKN